MAFSEIEETKKTTELSNEMKYTYLHTKPIRNYFFIREGQGNDINAITMEPVERDKAIFFFLKKKDTKIT